MKIAVTCDWAIEAGVDAYLYAIHSIGTQWRRESNHAEIVRSSIVSGSEPDGARRIVSLSSVVRNRDRAWVVVNRGRTSAWLEPVIIDRAVGIFIKTVPREKGKGTFQRRFPSVAPDTRRIIVGGIIGNDIVGGERMNNCETRFTTRSRTEGVAHRHAVEVLIVPL